jgi:hypothetical protein
MQSYAADEHKGLRICDESITALEAALAAPPQRQPLTDEQIDALELPESGTGTIRDLVRVVEKAHNIGGDK